MHMLIARDANIVKSFVHMYTHKNTLHPRMYKLPVLPGQITEGVPKIGFVCFVFFCFFLCLTRLFSVGRAMYSVFFSCVKNYSVQLNTIVIKMNYSL